MRLEKYGKRHINVTKSSGLYGPFLLAPAEGIGGPFGPPTSSQIKNSILPKEITEKIAFKVGDK